MINPINRFLNYKFFKFLLLKIFSFIANFVLVLMFVNYLHFGNTLSYSLALIIVLVCSYFLMAKFVFKVSISVNKLISYTLNVGLISLLSVPFFFLLDEILHVSFLVNTLFSLAVTFFLKFTILDSFVFTDKRRKSTSLSLRTNFILSAKNQTRQFLTKINPIILIATALFFINFLFISINTRWDSDYVSTFLLYPDYFRNQIYISSNTFLYKFLYYSPIIHLLGFSRKSILALGLINSAAIVTVFYMFYSKFVIVKNYKYFDKLLLFSPLLILSVLSTQFFRYISHTFLRNSEIAIFFIILYLLLDKFQKHVSINHFLLLFVLSFVLYISDPFFIFVLAIPSLIVVVHNLWSNKISSTASYKALTATISVPCSLFAQKLLQQYFPIFINSKLKMDFIPISQFDENVINTILSFQHLFDAHFWSFSIQSLEGIQTSLRFAFIIFGMYLSIFMWKKIDNNNILISRILVMSNFVGVISYIFSTISINLETSRYLIIFPFVFILSIGSYISCHLANGTKSRYFLLISSLSLLIFSNWLSFIPYYQYRKLEDVHSQEFSVINQLLMENVTYGYSDFWNAGLITFLSQNRVQSRQIICRNNSITPFRWAAAESWVEAKSSRNSSFMIVHPQGNSKVFYDDTCNKEKIISIFGNPTKELSLNTATDNKSYVLIFPYDISEKFSY